MLQNLTKCDKKMQNVRKMQNVTKCDKKVQNVTKCCKLLQNVAKWLQNENKNAVL